MYDKHGLLEDPDALQQMRIVCRRGRQNMLDIVPVEDLDEFIDSYQDRYATLISPKSKRLGDPIDDLHFSEEGLIIFGCEDCGLPRTISRRQGTQKFVVPVVNPVECFGLAEAYAIVIYEYLRQQNSLPRYEK